MDWRLLISIVVLSVLHTGISSSSYQSRFRRKVFVVSGQSVDLPSPLTTDLEVNGTYRYPCYIKVFAYEDQAFTKPLAGAQIIAVTRDPIQVDNYFGYSQVTSGRDGSACVLSLCRERAFIQVKDGQHGENLYADSKQKDLPLGLTFKTKMAQQELEFDPRDVSMVTTVKTGPVYQYNEKATCDRAGKNNHHFLFSFLGVRDLLTATQVPLSTYHNPLSWNYDAPGERTEQHCFIKVSVRTTSHSITAVLDSKMVPGGRMYGRFTTGALADPKSKDKTDKASCLQFRCPGLDNRNQKMDVQLEGKFTDPLRRNGCCFRVRTNLTSQMRATPIGFSMTVHTHNNYGPFVGIYKAPSRTFARTKCYAGTDDVQSSYGIVPGKNPAIIYDCISCARPGPIVG